MADVPDRFLDGWREGFWPHDSAVEWMNENPEAKEQIEAYEGYGISEEWAFAFADQNVPAPTEWEHVSIERESDGTWDVHILTEGGEAFTIDAANSDELASDYIFADLYFLFDEYDIDVDKDIDYSGE